MLLTYEHFYYITVKIMINDASILTQEVDANLESLSETKITNMIEKYLKNKTFVIVTHRPKLKELCNKHYVFEEHMMKELVSI